MNTNKKLFLLQLLAGLMLLLAALLGCNSRPDCTIRETGSGTFEPYGNCDNCSELSIIGRNGGMRPMAPSDMDRYVHQYPPSAQFNPASPSLSDWMLYHYLLSGPRAPHYQTVYVNQYNGYNGYRRTHPSYSYSTRTSSRGYDRAADRNRVINRTTIINNRTVIRNSTVRGGRMGIDSRITTRRPSYSSSTYSSSRRTISRPYGWSRPSTSGSSYKSYSSTTTRSSGFGRSSTSSSRSSYSSGRRR